MKTPKMKRSARLVIPVTGLSEEEAVPGKEVSAEQVETALKRLDDVTRKTRKARLKKGSGAAKKAVASGRRGKKEIRHIIRRGDTLSKIAGVYGVTPGQLSARNNLKEGQALPRGRVLRIPSES
jgi:LysM repeat protein